MQARYAPMDPLSTTVDVGRLAARCRGDHVLPRNTILRRSFPVRDARLEFMMLLCGLTTSPRAFLCLPIAPTLERMNATATPQTYRSHVTPGSSTVIALCNARETR